VSTNFAKPTPNVKMTSYCDVTNSVYFSGGSRPGVCGGSQIEGRQKFLHLLKYQRLSATKKVIFCRLKSGYFCWSNYAVFQGRTTVWKRFISVQVLFSMVEKLKADFDMIEINLVGSFLYHIMDSSHETNMLV